MDLSQLEASAPSTTRLLLHLGLTMIDYTMKLLLTSEVVFECVGSLMMWRGEKNFSVNLDKCKIKKK